MKKLFLLITLIGCAVIAKGQSSEYRNFKFDIGLGYAIPTTSTAASSSATTKAGVVFTLQPHFRLSDNLAVGLRIEGAGLGYENGQSGNTSVNVQFLYSYCATAEYYLLKGGFRPFVGGGVGFFNQQSANVDSTSNNSNVAFVPGGTKFGFFPEVGFEAGHFRMSVAYNAIGKDDFGNNNSYASFNIGFFFGGGKKK